MKRLLAILLAGAMLIFLVACSENPKNSTGNESNNPNTTQNGSENSSDGENNNGETDSLLFCIPKSTNCKSNMNFQQVKIALTNNLFFYTYRITPHWVVV